MTIRTIHLTRAGIEVPKHPDDIVEFIRENYMINVVFAKYKKEYEDSYRAEKTEKNAAHIAKEEVATGKITARGNSRLFHRGRITTKARAEIILRRIIHILRGGRKWLKRQIYTVVV